MLMPQLGAQFNGQYPETTRISFLDQENLMQEPTGLPTATRDTKIDNYWLALHRPSINKTIELAELSYNMCEKGHTPPWHGVASVKRVKQYISMNYNEGASQNDVEMCQQSTSLR